MRAVFLSILVFAVTRPTVLAADTRASGQPAFRHFNVEDGLSQGSVNAILQDHKGFIWIGTHDGLNRFDGTEFRVFRNVPGDTGSLSSNWIISLMEDSTHAVWVKTEKGLDRFDRARESFEHFPEVPGSRPYIPAGDQSGFWVADRPLGLYLPEKNEYREVSVQLADGLTFTPQVLARDGEGYIWVADQAWLVKIDPATRIGVEQYKLNTGGVSCLLPGRSGGLWLGASAGLFRFRDNYLRKVGQLDVTSLAEDSHGFLWIGTREGVARMLVHDTTGASMERLRHDPVVSTSLSHNVVTHIIEDMSGAVWVGTYNGLNLLNRLSAPFSVYRSSPDNPQGISGNFVLPMVEDRQGNIWFGTFGSGVSQLLTSGPRAGTFIHFKNNPSAPSSLRGNNVRSLVSMQDGRILIGSTVGINVYDPSTGTMSVAASFGAEAMCQTRDGSILVPQSGMLLRLVMTGTQARIVDSMYIDNLQSTVFIDEDTRGDIWIGTTGYGLLKIDARARQVFSFVHDPNDRHSLSNNNVWAAFEDPADSSATLWVGTSNGLNRFSPGTGRSERYLEQEGFPNSWVYGILQDDQRRLWLSTNHGLVVFDERQPKGRQFRNYTHADGLAGNEFNRRSHCRLRNGEFLFGGTNGVTRFHPGLIRDNPSIPPLVLTGFSKLGKRITFDRDIADVSAVEVSHDENVLGFEFAALNYTNASGNQYAYMMEGVDEDWISSGTRRSVTYAYIPPGEYVFRVKASHMSGLWNDNQITVQVNVRPPFWATWWFIVLCACALAGIVTMIVRARVRRLLEVERLRSRIARDLHDEIGSNLSSIAMASDLLGRQSGLGDRERGKLSQISSVALSTVKDMKDMVWLLNPQNDALDDLFLRMKDTASTILEGREYTVSFPGLTNGRKVNLDWKRNVYLIYKESLTNVARHSGATNVRVDVRVMKDKLLVELTDNGTGFDASRSNGGNGLKNMKERSDLLGAKLEIVGNEGNGTTVRLEARIT